MLDASRGLRSLCCQLVQRYRIGLDRYGPKGFGIQPTRAVENLCVGQLGCDIALTEELSKRTSVATNGRLWASPGEVWQVVLSFSSDPPPLTPFG